MKKVQYYKSYEQDILTSKKQDYEINPNFKWLHQNIIYKLLTHILHFIAILIALIVTKLFLGVKIKNKDLLKKSKGYYIYSNHTLMLGDVLNPFIINFPKKPYILCSPANLGIPVIGKILPIMGALPIPSNMHDILKLKEAMSYYIKKEKAIVIYPEAHLWPYYNKIREFPYSSLHFPVDDKANIYTATTTYTKRKFFKRPKITIYIDGPFKIDENLTRKENIQQLHDIVYQTMVKRSELSNYEYVTYKKKDD